MEKQAEYGEKRVICQRARVAVMAGLTAWTCGRTGGGMTPEEVSELVNQYKDIGLLDCLGPICGEYPCCQGRGMTYNEAMQKYFPKTVEIKDKTSVPGL